MPTLHDLKARLMATMPHGSGQRIYSPFAIDVEGCGRALTILPSLVGGPWVAYSTPVGGFFEGDNLTYTGLEVARFDTRAQATEYADRIAARLRAEREVAPIRRKVAEALRIAAKKGLPFSPLLSF